MRDDEVSRQREQDLMKLRVLLEQRHRKEYDPPVPAREMANAIVDLMGLLHPIWSMDPEIERTWGRFAYGHYMDMTLEPGLPRYIRMSDNLQALYAIRECLARCMPRELQMKLGVLRGGEANA